MFQFAYEYIELDQTCYIYSRCYVAFKIRDCPVSGSADANPKSSVYVQVIY